MMTKLREAIVFTKSRPEIIYGICINNNIIKWKDEVKYLGLMLNSKLTFESHVKSVAQKAISKLIILYPLLNRRSNVIMQNKLLIYKVVIRLTLTYVCPVWSMICRSQYDKLQILQNKFLRLIGNFRKYSKISEMHAKLNVEYIHNFIKKLSTDYFNIIEKHQNPLVRSIKYKNKKYKYKRIMDIVYN